MAPLHDHCRPLAAVVDRAAGATELLASYKALLAGADDCAVLFDRDDGLFLIRFRSSDVQSV